MKCSLFEDRVFALLGLATEADRRVVRLHHSRPFAELQRHLAAYLLTSSWGRPLQVLHAMGIVHGDAAKRLPSWSRDWTAPRQTNWFLVTASLDLPSELWHMIPEQEGENKVGGYVSLDSMAANKPWVTETSAAIVGGEALNHLVRFSEDVWTLTLRGLSVDTVSMACAAPDGHLEDLVRVCRDSWEGAVLQRATAWEKPEDRLEAFCKLLCRESYRDSEGNVRTDCREAYESWVQDHNKLTTKKEGGASIVRPVKCDYGYRVQQLCAGRSLIITEKGHVGLGPVSTRAGDLVCYFQGNRDPFLLRDRDGLAEEYQKGVLPTTFVGDTLIIGLMNGEGLESIRGEEIAEFWIR